MNKKEKKETSDFIYKSCKVMNINPLNIYSILKEYDLFNVSSNAKEFKYLIFEPQALLHSWDDLKNSEKRLLISLVGNKAIINMHSLYNAAIDKEIKSRLACDWYYNPNLSDKDNWLKVETDYLNELWMRELQFIVEKLNERKWWNLKW